MANSDSPSRPAEPGGTSNLPVPVSRADADSDGFFARLARALFSWKNGPTRADIEVVLEATGPGEAGVSPEERTMIRNILALRGRRIEDVMVPRGDIIAVQQDISIGELVKVFEKAGHSRLVVYNDTLDDPIGMVHIRDLIAFMTARAAVDPDKPSRRKKQRAAGLDLGVIDLTMQLSSTKIMREMLFVLSMEDIVEQIVGDIADEHDEDELPSIVAQLDGSFVADARASLTDVTAAVGVAFDVGDAAEAVDTLGGYLMTQVGRLPLRGELVPGPAGFEIEVLDSDPRRIKKVRIHRSKDRPIERDREGRRRYSAPEATASPAIAPLPATENAAKAPTDSDAAHKS